MKRLITACVLTAAALTVAPARATIGSVISSFPIERDSMYGIYREGLYVYTSQRDNTIGNYLRKYTLNGVYLGRVRLLSGNAYPLYSGSRTHLGTGYVGLCDRNLGYFMIFSVSNGGAPVASFPVVSACYNAFCDGEYYYINPREDRGVFRRYTRNGAGAGTWTCSGWSPNPYCGGAEFARRGNRGEGPYFVGSSDTAGRPCGMTTFPGGSLVSTWVFADVQVQHLAYGDSSQPGTYGAAIWAITHGPDMVVEFDIDARNASTVMPASVGKIKAIYR
jgi:hypothetical protein